MNDKVLQIEDLTHIYSAGTPFEKTAVDHVSFTARRGEFIGLIGHTGSGKSTLIQHFNGLLRPTSGRVLINGEDIYQSKELTRAARFAVGLVFQYPEYQLFEETVYADVAFGPKNMGLDKDEIDRRVRENCRIVGLPDDALDKSPFDLSGGQKRRAAIAGVLSMRPEVLVLDEPIAGLDPMGRREILALVENYRRHSGATVVLVSHNMDDVADIADRVIVMHRGGVALDGTPHEVFSQSEKMQSLGLDVPQVTLLADELRRRGMDVPKNIITRQEMLEYLLSKGVAGCSAT